MTYRRAVPHSAGFTSEPPPRQTGEFSTARSAENAGGTDNPEWPAEVRHPPFRLHLRLRRQLGTHGRHGKTQPAANGTSYPACVAGKRNCPPEHPERAEQLEWIGEGFDPDAFVIETANTMLAAQFKRIQPAANRPSLD